ncbi:MAG: type II toxin-antitoxin system RelE/ParE family toxin [Candidatus Pacebacteria bacterium]|nr:type II toxin-antitoxin system RelE/ParE family toxin [Candidatus Paceibacterota bacterium]MDD5665482.1 type II toxin-antitoxin system RelE/ParE family toxin [Candidatus Omnitrophota bacterium]
MYTLIYSTGAEKDLAGLPKDVAVRIHTSLKKIKENPYNHVKKLEGTFAVPLYSFKVGREYRCILTIEDNKMVIFVIEIGHRKNIYRKY